MLYTLPEHPQIARCLASGYPARPVWNRARPRQMTAADRTARSRSNKFDKPNGSVLK
ncbi:MAG: hypothetical protein LUD55_06270 [Oscillospiraceae bacterium]|nr:hypothetical protein [Oscillospiraceae bacterium]